jgi:hypothetical protein
LFFIKVKNKLPDWVIARRTIFLYHNLKFETGFRAKNHYLKHKRLAFLGPNRNNTD